MWEDPDMSLGPPTALEGYVGGSNERENDQYKRRAKDFITFSGDDQPQNEVKKPRFVRIIRRVFYSRGLLAAFPDQRGVVVCP